MISVAIQGGAMRSIYCLGAIRALVESGHAAHVRTIHTASAGCVSAAVLASQLTDPGAPSVADTGERLLDRLAGTRFINQRRMQRIVDVDYLVETIRDVTSISARPMAERGLVFEVGMTDAVSGAAQYIDVARSMSDSDLFQAFRATMAIPILYPPAVRISGRRYLDGGIVDPLPVLRALRHGPRIVVAISSVADSTLGEAANGREARFIRYAPGISPAVRHLMLTRKPLAEAVDNLIALDSISGIRIVRIAPSDPTLLGHRLEVDKRKLFELEGLGYRDGLQALSTLNDWSENSGLV
jgi:predicted patatin/cPLA2 family phospholipase